MESKQRFMVVLSFLEAVLVCCLVMSIVGLSKGLEDGIVILTRGSEKPPTRSQRVVAGGKLILHCTVSTDMLFDVWWGKESESGDVYLTDRKGSRTGDSRVSLSISANFTRNNTNQRTYTIRISPVAVTDAANYFCLATWKLSTYNNARTDAQGKLIVSVTGFENGNPYCWSTGHFTNRSLVWCKTEHAYPGVNITWTVEGTGQVVLVTSADMIMDDSGRKWVRSSYEVCKELQNQVLVCTVKSPLFPGRNQTCSIAPPLNTTANPNTTNTPTGPTSECLEATSATRPLTSTSATSGPITESPPDVVTVSAAVAIPSFTLLLIVFLLCFLKRRRRQPGTKGRGKDSGPTTDAARSNCEAGRVCGVIQTSVMRMPQHGSGRTIGAGGDDFDSPYEEVELDQPVAGSTTSAEAPGKDGLVQNNCVIYQTVHPDDSDCDTSSWESDSMHQEGVNSYNDNVVTGGDSDKFEASPARSDESDGRMIDNPIYQSYDDEYLSH